jgi:hypothetical protein
MEELHNAFNCVGRLLHSCIRHKGTNPGHASNTLECGDIYKAWTNITAGEPAALLTASIDKKEGYQNKTVGQINRDGDVLLAWHVTGPNIEGRTLLVKIGSEEFPVVVNSSGLVCALGDDNRYGIPLICLRFHEVTVMYDSDLQVQPVYAVFDTVCRRFMAVNRWNLPLLNCSVASGMLYKSAPSETLLPWPQIPEVPDC